MTYIAHVNTITDVERTLQNYSKGGKTGENIRLALSMEGDERQSVLRATANLSNTLGPRVGIITAFEIVTAIARKLAVEEREITSRERTL